MLTIKAPATTANVAAGFDCFGMCLDLANTYVFEDFDDAIIVNNYADTFRNKENLVIKSFIRTADIMNYNVKGLKLNIHTEIPLARGLGSSASCITAGVAAAYYYFEKEIDYDDVFYISALLEGHPDNVCPSLFGGFTISYKNKDLYKYSKIDVPERYRFLAIIPNYELSTEKARMILPGYYPLEDAVYNVSRASLLIKGLLTDDPKCISEGLSDKLHQPYRASLIKDYDKLNSLCKTAGALGTYISGAGPTLMAITDKEETYSLLHRYFTENNIDYVLREFKVNNDGLKYTVS